MAVPLFLNFTQIVDSDNFSNHVTLTGVRGEDLPWNMLQNMHAQQKGPSYHINCAHTLLPVRVKYTITFIDTPCTP